VKHILSSVGFALALSVAAASATPAQANLLVNGSFESPAFGGRFLVINPGQEPAGFGWTVGGNNVDIFNDTIFGPSFTFDGNQALDLVGNNNIGSIAQTFATVAGETYTLSFAFSSNPSANIASAAVSITDGLESLLSETIEHSTSSAGNPDWTMFSMTFVATGDSATLEFLSILGGRDAGILLDAISIEGPSASIPEPGTLSLLGAGLAGLGMLRIRRRRP
jgi:choice-of-anchor C domain-containing protein